MNNKFNTITNVSTRLGVPALIFTSLGFVMVGFKGEIKRYKDISDEHKLYMKHLENVIKEDELRYVQLSKAASQAGTSFGTVD